MLLSFCLGFLILSGGCFMWGEGGEELLGFSLGFFFLSGCLSVFFLGGGGGRCWVFVSIAVLPSRLFVKSSSASFT